MEDLGKEELAGKVDELVKKLREHGPLAATKTGRAKVKYDEDGLKPLRCRYAQAENADSCADALETDADERVKHDKKLLDQWLDRMSKEKMAANTQGAYPRQTPQTVYNEALGTIRANITAELTALADVIVENEKFKATEFSPSWYTPRPNVSILDTLRLWHLNAKQARFVFSFLTVHEENKLRFRAGEEPMQFKGHCIGQAGTGKSQVLLSILWYFTMKGEEYKVRTCAYTGGTI